MSGEDIRGALRLVGLPLCVSGVGMRGPTPCPGLLFSDICCLNGRNESRWVDFWLWSKLIFLSACNKIERISAQLHILDLALYVLFTILKLWPFGDCGPMDGSGGSGHLRSVGLWLMPTLFKQIPRSCRGPLLHPAPAAPHCAATQIIQPGSGLTSSSTLFFFLLLWANLRSAGTSQ